MLQTQNAPKATVISKIKDLIQTVSFNGRFQRNLLVFFIIVSFFTNFQLTSLQIFFMNPSFQCENIEGKVAQDQACQMLKFCSLINQQTIVAELNIYCDEGKNERTMLQSAIAIGRWVGIFISGALSDRKGRKFCFCLGLVLLNLTTVFLVIGVFLHSIPLLIIAVVILGFSSKVIYLNFLVILTRFLSKEKCDVGTIAWFIVGNGIVTIFIAIIYEYFSSWRLLAYIPFIGLLMCSFVSLFILKQDPIYLFEIGQINESKRVIQSIGEQNGVDFNTNQQNVDKLDDIFEMQMTQIQNNHEQEYIFDYTQLLRCDIVIKIVIVGVVGGFQIIATNSIDLSLNTLQYSYTFNLFVTGISNICGFISAIYVTQIQKQKRRGFIVSSCIYAIIATLLIFPFCQQNGIVQITTMFFLRILLGWMMNFYTRLKVDVFPEKYQMACISIIEAISNIGTVFGPILVQQSVDHHVNPIFAINLLRITIGTLPLLFLSEKRINLYEQYNFKDKHQKAKEMNN